MRNDLSQLVRGSRVQIINRSNLDHQEAVFAGYEGSENSRKAVFVWPSSREGHINGLKVFVNHDFEILEDEGTKVVYGATTQWAGVYRGLQLNFDSFF